MDEERIARLVADTLQWASDRASSPAIINCTAGGDTIEFLVVPGERVRLTVEKLDD